MFRVRLTWIERPCEYFSRKALRAVIGTPLAWTWASRAGQGKAFMEKAQVLHSQARIVGSDTGLEAPRDVVVRLSRPSLRGADLRLERHALVADARWSKRAGAADEVASVRCTGVIALVGIASVARLRRERTALRALLLDRPSGARARELARAAESWLDELRRRDHLDDLVEWLVRARPSVEEIGRERLSVARAFDRRETRVERFGVAHGALA